MKRTLQNTVPVLAANATSFKKVQAVLEPGRYIGVAVYKSAANNNNTGTVRASIQNSAGEYIADLVHIDDYRSRDTAYLQGCKPIRVDGGSQVTITIIAEANFTADTSFDFVFVADPAECHFP